MHGLCTERPGGKGAVAAFAATEGNVDVKEHEGGRVVLGVKF